MWQSFDEISAFGREFIESSMKSLASVSKDTQAIAAEAADYSRRSFEAGSRVLEKIVSADSFEKAVELQVQHAKQSYEALVAEAARLTELYADMAKGAYRPYESLAVRAR